jgi:hypothetical protein
MFLISKSKKKKKMSKVVIKNNFSSKSTAEEVLGKDIDLSNKTIFITGANSGFIIKF